MRKNDPLCMVDISESGEINKTGNFVGDSALFPLQHRQDARGLVKWWNNRAVPISQGRIKEMLEKAGCITSQELLVKNLGLSLTDYYWINPIDSDLTWEKVNLYDNDFCGSLSLVYDGTDSNPINEYNPCSSLQGQLEKSWIIQNGERMLVKGNRNELSSESINEVIATKLHEKQGFNNYTPYQLIKITGREYDFGCISKAFTSLNKELVSAYDIITSEKQPNSLSTYEHFIAICGKHGIDVDLLRQHLEYQIMTDFILSNTDRHLSNVAILRDAESLDFLQMAPIYDSGKSFFVGSAVKSLEKDLLDVKVSSFASKELKLLSYVQDRSLVDIDKLPPASFIQEMYRKDSKIEPERIRRIVECYERKVDLFAQFQQGRKI